MAVEYLEPIPILKGQVALDFIRNAKNVKPVKLSDRQRKLVAEIKKYSTINK